LAASYLDKKFIPHGLLLSNHAGRLSRQKKFGKGLAQHFRACMVAAQTVK
jgi:hypothetical protein